VSAPYWLSVYTAGKMWENERLKNVENQISGYSGYLKMWKKMMFDVYLDTRCHIFGYACFFFIFCFLLLIVVYAARSLIDES